MKRAQEPRVDEFSVQKLRESHETIQRHTSQVQGFQERMNYLNVSGEFHEVESNCSGTCSHVPSQPARIPSPRAMLGCDRRFPLDTWNRSGSQENVFAYPRSTLESAQTPYRGIHQFATPSAAGETCGNRGRTNWKHNPNADLRKKAARRPRTPLVLRYSAEFYGWTVKTADIGTSIW